MYIVLTLALAEAANVPIVSQASKWRTAFLEIELTDMHLGYTYESKVAEPFFTHGSFLPYGY
jgi:hypothetical protein